MTKGVTVGGIIILAAGVFTHPETCISAPQFLAKFIPLDPDILSHICVAIGGALLALGRGLLEKTNVSTNNVQAP